MAYEEVEFCRGFREILQFLIRAEIGRREDEVNRFHEQTVNFYTQRVSCVFWHMRQEVVPDLVCRHQVLDDGKRKVSGGGAYLKIFMKIQLVHGFEKIAEMGNLLEAWREFLNGKHGKRDVQEFGMGLMDNLFS